MFGTLLIAADLAATVAFSDRTEVRVRAPGTPPVAASLDLETAPIFELRLASQRWRYAVTYAPRLTLWDAGGGATRPTLLNGGTARVEWRRHVSLLSLEQTGSYGGMDFAAASLAASGDGPPVYSQLAPAPLVIQYASSTTTIVSRSTLRLWTVELLAGYQATGGADDAARSVLPFQRGPLGSLTGTFAASRLDDVVLSALASEASFSSGPEGLVAEVDAGVRHRWSRVADTKVTAGVSEARVRLDAKAGHAVKTYPVAEVVVDRHPAPVGHVGLRLGVRLGPVVNRLIGLVDERVEGSLAFRYEEYRFATHLASSASQSIPVRGAIATSMLAGELGTAYTTTPVVVVDAGLRAFWQRQEVTQASFVQGVFFVGVTLRAPPTRL
jgi:hypothetical protein